MDRLSRNTHRSVEEKKIHFFACGLLLAATPFFRERAGNQVENNELVGFVCKFAIVSHCPTSTALQSLLMYSHIAIRYYYTSLCCSLGSKGCLRASRLCRKNSLDICDFNYITCCKLFLAALDDNVIHPYRYVVFRSSDEVAILGSVDQGCNAGSEPAL